jgi:hypothetical protein
MPSDTERADRWRLLFDSQVKPWPHSDPSIPMADRRYTMFRFAWYLALVLLAVVCGADGTVYRIPVMLG